MAEAGDTPYGSARPKFTLIQALRGFAALWVVLFHASEGRHIEIIRAATPSWLYASVFDAGHLGVAIFFALSGFVIAHSIRGATITPRYLGRFVLRRSIRLDPPYWASIALVTVLAAFSAWAKHEPFHGGLSAGQIASHLTYTQELLRFPEINTVCWTLTYEVQFYLVLVFGQMLAQRTRLPPGLVLIGPLLITVWTWTDGLSIPGLFTNLWPCFLIGAFGYWGIESRTYATASFALAVTVLFVHPAPFECFSMATGLGLLLAGRIGWLETMGSRPIQLLGAISYSLYLTHNSVTRAVFFLLTKAHTSEPIALVVTVGICIGVAAFFWLLIERPAMRVAHLIRLSGSVKLSKDLGSADELPPANERKRR